VTFSDQSEAIYSVPATATDSTSWSLLAETGTISDIPALYGAASVSFGLPGFSSGAESHLVNLQMGTAGITGSNNAALVSGTTLLAQMGSPAPDATGAPASGAVFAQFSDPVTASSGAVAFEATLTGTGVTPSNNLGIWFAADGVIPKAIARTGDAAPGGGHFANFTSMVLPGSTGPIFVATLSLSAADGVTGKNNLGLWAVDGSGALQLLFRTGQSAITGGQTKTVRFFSALAPVLGSVGAASGYDNSGNVSVLATFTDGTQATLNVASH
jgi:hypothetical protein